MGIIYNGKINEGLTKIKGEWAIEDDVQGKFEIRAMEDNQNPKFTVASDGKVLWKHKEGWVHIGDDARQIQYHLKHVFLVENDSREIYKWEYGQPHEWEKIGDKCKKLIVT